MSNMFNLMNPNQYVDPKLEAIREKRRKAEEERKHRFFNPRVRQIGVDLETLRKQIEEQKSSKHESHMLNKAYEQEVLRRDTAVKELDRQIKGNLTQVQKDLQDYRREYQKFEDRREFDLNDPDYLKKSNLNGGEKNSYGLSSCMTFDGDDPNHKERTALKCLERKSWLHQQALDKQMENKRQQEVEKYFEQRRMEAHERAYLVACAKERAKKELLKDLAEHNMVYAQKAKEQRELEKQADLVATLSHQRNMASSNLMTETAERSLNVKPCDFKGYSSEKVEEIRKEQCKQIQEKLEKTRFERETEARYIEKMRRDQAVARLADAEIHKRQVDKNVELERTNRELAFQQKIQEEYRNEILCKSKPTEEFFDQFNRSTR